MKVPHPTTILFILLLLLGGALRYTALDSVPPGLTHDEADHGLDAAGVLEGDRPIYFTVGYGREPLYDYATSLTMLVVGTNFWAGRLTAATFGMALMVLTYVLVWRWSGNKWLALATMAGMAVSFWTVSTSRQALRSITLPVMYTGSALSLLAGLTLTMEDGRPRLRLKNWAWFVVAGVFLGAMGYTYLAARIMWGVFPALAIALAVLRPRSLGRAWPGLLITLAVGAAVVTPLALYLINNPAAEVRIGQLSSPLDAFLAGDPGPLLNNATAGLGMISFSGDDLWLYNIPGRPLLNPALSGLFFVGVVVALVEAFTPYRRTTEEPPDFYRRTSLHIFMIGTLLAGLLPALITGVGASNVRVIGMQPALYYFPAVGVLWLAAWAARQIGERGPVTIAVGYGLVIAASTVTEGYAYFNTWANARDVRVAYHTTLVETLRYLDETDSIGPDVALSTITPGQFHDPAVAAMVLQRDDLALRWFDGRSALVVDPDVPQTYFFPEIAPLDPLLSGYVDAETLTRLELRPTDFNRTVEVIRWAPESLPTPAEAYQIADLLRFRGAVLPPDVARPGDVVEVATVWTVTGTTEAEVVLFTHALDENGQLIAQHDELGVPTSSWVMGDALIQVHRLTIPPEYAGGPLRLVVGAYTLPDIARLPVTAEDGTPAGDTIPLMTLEIAE